MKLVARILIGLAALVGIAAAGLYVLVNYSTTQLSLTCSGRWDQGAEGIKGEPETVYAVIELYRPWLVWAKSKGNLTAQSRDLALALYVSNLAIIGDEPLALYQFNDLDGLMLGGYRSAPRELTLQFNKGLVFSGECSEGI